MENIFDVVVCGAGIMGLSSALYCRKAGLNVMLLEQFSFPHTRGSSHGASRITRKAYLESSEISKMMQEAHDLWREIENETNSKLHLKIGTLYVEQKPSELIKGIAAVSDKLGYEYTMMNDDELASRYSKSFTFPGYMGLLDHDGGLLRADVCCNKIFELFRSLGGFFKDLSPIAEIRPGAITEIITQSGITYRAKKVILATGPWSGNILKQLDLDLPLKPEAVSVTYWRSKNNSFTADTFPCFYDVNTHVYALPAFEYPGLVKLVDPHTNEKGKDPNARDFDSTPLEVLKDFYGPYLKDHFPNLEPTPAIVERCLYTRTPDDLWIIDQHPVHQNIVILAGFSGHGFKAGPLIGKVSDLFVSTPEAVCIEYYQLASELVQGMQPNRYKMSDFSITRFM